MNRRPMFPHVIDSSMLNSFRSCPQKFFRSYVEHWKPKEESVHLVAGGAFAKGIEEARAAFFIEGLGKGEAEVIGIEALFEAYGDFQCPPDSAKSLERTAGALEFYFSQYPLGADGMTPIKLAGGKHGIEFSFAEALPVMHPTTGDPILYAGRADMIAHFAGGIYIVDEKTTSSLGPSWNKKWDMRSQFTGYTWAAKANNIQVEGVIIRGVSILRTKYDTQQVLTSRLDFEVERWLEQTCRDIDRMQRMWAEDWWDYALDEACTEYGGCPLVRICKSQQPEEWLPMYFEQRVWDPIGRKEWTVEEWDASWEMRGE